jgi:hypothetical protein
LFIPDIGVVIPTPTLPLTIKVLAEEAVLANVAYDAEVAFVAEVALVAVAANVAYEAEVALPALVALVAVAANTAYEAVLACKAREAVTALSAIEADWALTAQLPVPNKEPVTPLVTLREFKTASEPLTMTFFQFGILYTFALWLDTYTYAVYMPTSC